ncbi:S-layer homology domain-containing protein [Bacillus sp. B190/17]|uniref:S-layer homology domain-containing protein n=1 Tax=Bacillus lumedeiriae TaxID=3058829 RepID=A0ABW8I8G4_9BACI
MKKYLSGLLVFCLFISSTIVASAAFEDVSREHWAVDEITFLTDKKVISGFPDRTFRPQAQVTRLQAMILMAQALKLDLKNRPDPGFKDLSKSNANYKYAAAIVDEGIFPKVTYLNPNQPITRELMARMIAIGFKLKPTGQNKFADVPSSHWAHPYVSALADNNITLGYSEGKFEPSKTLTRGQFSVFLARALNDRYKTFNFYNKRFNFILPLPNYMKDKLTYNTTIEGGIYYTSFYYNDQTFLNNSFWVGGIDQVHKSKKSIYDNPWSVFVKQSGDYYYYFELPHEHPYANVDPYYSSREAKEYFQYANRLFNMSKSIQSQ